MTRNPPERVKRALRSEVGFGCPIPGCGSPYLTYHHFDPPWHVEQHHEPARMIALCLQHHQNAEGGAFTAEQLRGLKLRPFLATGHVRWRFDVWDQRRLVLFAGSNWFFNPSYVLSVRDQEVVGLSQPHGSEPGGLNLDVRDREGQRLMSMEMNAWNLEIVPDHLVCSPRGNTLTVSHKASNLDLQIRFRSLAPETMERLLDRLGATGDSRQDVLDSVEAWPVALATLEGTFHWPVPIAMARNGTWGNRSGYRSCVFRGIGIRV